MINELYDELRCINDMPIFDGKLVASWSAMGKCGAD